MLWSVRVCLCACLVAGQRVPPNIVVIMADDMGWNDVGYHGTNDLLTPNIDALAYNGIMLQRYYTSPSCTPSRTAFLTGKYPFRIGMQGPPLGAGQPRGIPLNETLLPQYLKQLGYSTHLIGKWHVGHYTKQHTPTRRGFDSFFGYHHGYIGYFDGVHSTGEGLEGRGSGSDVYRNMDDAFQEFNCNYATDLFTKEAQRIIEAHDKSRPLYLQVAHLAPHTGNPRHGFEVRNIVETMDKFSHIEDKNRRLYAGMVEALDDSVGQIVSSLKDNGLLENSIVVFMSDNGASVYEPIFDTSSFGSNWPLRGEKFSLYDGGVRVPAFIYSPLLTNHAASSILFHVTDWLPTFYDAAGGDISTLPMLDGVSQWSALKNGERGLREMVVLDIDEFFQQAGLIQDAWKVIKYNVSSPIVNTYQYFGSSGRDPSLPEYNLTAVQSSPAHQAIPDPKHPHTYKNQRMLSQCVNDVNRSCTDGVCLYNILQDPCERRDLSADEPEVLQELLAVLDGYRKVLVPRNNFTQDPRSYPRFWHNRWVPWLDDEVDVGVIPSGSEGHESSIVFIFVLSTAVRTLYVLLRGQ